MNTRTRIRSGAMLVALALTCFAACKKTTETGTSTLNNDDVAAAQDEAQAEKANNDVDNIADNVGIYGSANMRTVPIDLGTCMPTITLDTVSSTRVLTIDFGSTGCTDLKGNTRKGKIIVTFTGKYRDSGSSHTISFSNYFFNSTQLTGSKTVTNNGRNSSGDYTYSIVVNDSLILGSGDIINWTGNRTRVWTKGYGTATIWDDEYDIYGTTTVTRPSGRSTTFSVDSSSPLHIVTYCRWIESGVLTATRSSGGSYSIDYGSGSCDDKGTLTVGGKTYNITLR